MIKIRDFSAPALILGSSILLQAYCGAGSALDASKSAKSADTNTKAILEELTQVKKDMTANYAQPTPTPTPGRVEFGNIIGKSLPDSYIRNADGTITLLTVDGRLADDYFKATSTNYRKAHQ